MLRVSFVLAAALLFTLALSSSSTDAQTWSSRLGQEPACQTLTPSAAGGALPKNPNLIVLRYLGVSNYELTYKDTVILLDAGIDKLSWWVPTGVTAADMTKKVNAIFIGHAHGEHLWSAPMIAQKTGALVAGDPLSVAAMSVPGMPAQQLRTVKGLGEEGDFFKFNGFTVEAVLGHHNIVPGDYMAKDRAAAQAVGALQPPLTPEQQARDKQLNAQLAPLPQGQGDRLIKEGTISYLFQFDNGFRLWYGDSAGPTTTQEQALAKRIGSVDVGLIPYYGGELAIPITMEYVRLLKPWLVLPTHHDGHRNRMLDMPIGPLGLAMRDENPKSVALSPLYRTPICIDTVTKEYYVGQ
jgi:L-ascorbate metabolism protein UlaG (beta-lactamase superfamily)